MCGLTGFWDFSARSNKEQLVESVNRMIAKINHRGPDDTNIWVDQKNNIAIGHCRLSIIDLTVAGKQPMESSSGRFVLSYNGEVYNAPQIRDELNKLGHNFRGSSDTEVIIQSFEAWGIVEASKKFIGMFALAVWDNKLEELTLIRDRLGVKPLYFGIINNILFFGSQIKSFLVHPLWQGNLDKNALSRYIKFNYVPAPYSIFQNIVKLEPATILTINKQQKINKILYWDLTKIIADQKVIKKSINLKNSEIEIIKQLDDLLKSSIKMRMLSDVPLGAFLSGGIDSSLVVALMQELSNTKIRTFTIGFNEQSYNEANFAKEVAQHLGTNHQELILDPKQALDLIPTLPDIYDEPFADSSQIPTLLVAKLARQQVTVALSGDGGDELFAGYNRYSLWNNIFSKIAWMPNKLRKILANSISGISLNNWDLINRIVNIRNLGDRVYKLANILPFNTAQDFYSKVISFWLDQDPLLHPSLVSTNYNIPADLNFIEEMQFSDLNNYLPDDILTKVDRASMAYGLEAREPLLDHRLVEFSWQLPMNYKIRYGEQKWILKKILAKYLPQKLINRPKMGFGVPIEVWLRNELRDWAIDLLNPKKLEEQGLFNSKIINEKLQQHLSGTRNHQYDLWGILMFQAWYNQYILK
ncbi:MAG: asparagine synthase (glutamine-hydrolyzing) [Gammaproteobacteria bacterium]|jgi:asparagine synthase (glutamine-hydrolysing)